MTETGTLREKINRRIFVDHRTGCWQWRGHIDSKTNEPIFKPTDTNPLKIIVRRILYTEAFGKIADGAAVVQDCTTEYCVAPKCMRLEHSGKRSKPATPIQDIDQAIEAASDLSERSSATQARATERTGRVSLIAATDMINPEYLDEKWAETSDGFATDGELLAEAVGRVADGSWDRPVKRQRSNQNFLATMLRWKCFELLEHGSATLRLSHVPIYLAGELATADTSCAIQDLTADVALSKSGDILADVSADPNAARLATVVDDAVTELRFAFDSLLYGLRRARVPNAIDVASAILPSGTLVSMVVTASYAEWRSMIERARASDDSEYLAIGEDVLSVMLHLAPRLFTDMTDN